MEEKMILDDDEGSLDQKERAKVKNKRNNFTISEIRTVLNHYEKCGKLRETAKYFDIPPSTLAGWIKKKDEYYTTTIKKTNYRLKPGGRKSDSQEYDDILVEFIKEGRASDLAITSSEVIFKAIQIIPEFKYKSYNSLHLWFKRFRTRNSYSIRRITKVAQRLPKNVLENVREFLYNALKDNYEYNTDINANIIANVDETPIVLEPITGTTLEKIGEKTVQIRTFGKSKERVSCILCIFANGSKAPPMLVFKGVPEGTLEKKLNKLPEVAENKVLILCQKNAWVDIQTFIKWLNIVWFRSYPFRNIEGSILYFDKASSHLNSQITEMFKKNKCFFRVIPPGLTSYCQPLDLCINKPFKDAIKAKYREFCIKWQNTKKPNAENLIQWVSDIWWSDTITENNIKMSFKKGGINLKFDGSEDIKFTWPKSPDMVLVEEIPSIKKESNNNSINFEINKREDDDNSDEEDILFDYERYNITSIRNEVIRDSKFIEDNEIEMEDNKIITKDYDYYKAFDFFN